MPLNSIFAIDVVLDRPRLEAASTLIRKYDKAETKVETFKTQRVRL